MMILQARVNVALVVVGVVLAGTAGLAQNTATPAPQIPTGRQGRGGYPLPALPGVFETYQHKVRVSVDVEPIG